MSATERVIEEDGERSDVGEPVARFRSLFDDAYDDLTRFVRRRVTESHADDVVSETFLAAWRRLGDVPHLLDDARAWLFGTARNVILTMDRGRVRQGRLALKVAEELNSAPPPGGHGEDPAHTVPSRADVAGAFAALSDADAEVLSLVAWDGLTTKEAAGVLGITPTAFSVRLTRAPARPPRPA
ncbi:putative RNA polymerase ECF-subfamily sigma factor [Actinomycetales bacterium JB111]|nr:putative RNA polymerase ECF-subfamily sigma factor [Actinomycetales bacterium JB111]